MNGDSWNIERAEGGFIVYTNKQDEPPVSTVMRAVPRVFTDSAAVLNFLHNELVGSN